MPDSAPKSELYKLEWLKDITFDPKNEPWLIASILPANGLGVLYGKPKKKKSFIVLSMAMAPATGERWAGFESAKGIVVVLTTEGAKGMRKRFVAWRLHAGVPEGTRIAMIDASPDLGSALGDCEKFIQSIEAELGGDRPILIVIDTLAGTLGGEDENHEGMDNFILNTKTIGNYFGCFVLAVHHEPWNADRMRGRSTLPAAVDVSLRVDSNDKFTSTLTIEAAKDMEDDRTFTVSFQSVDMGYDAMLERQATTLIVDKVDELDDDKPKPKKLSKSLSVGLSILEFALNMNGKEARPYGNDGPVLRCVEKEKDLRPLYYERRGDLENQDSRRNAFNNFLRDGRAGLILNTQVLADGRVLVWRT